MFPVEDAWGLWSSGDQRECGPSGAEDVGCIDRDRVYIAVFLGTYDVLSGVVGRRDAPGYDSVAAISFVKVARAWEKTVRNETRLYGLAQADTTAAVRPNLESPSLVL